MFRIAAVFMFGCAVVLASDASFARARIHISSPAKAAAVPTTKPGMVQQTKPGMVQQQKPGAVETQKPFAAAPRHGFFVNVNTSRPLAAAPGAAAPQRGMHESGERLGLVPYDPSRGSADRASAQAQDIAAEVSTDAPNTEPKPASVRMAAPARTGRPHAVTYCYVQLSGECIPF